MKSNLTSQDLQDLLHEKRWKEYPVPIHSVAGTLLGELIMNTSTSETSNNSTDPLQILSQLMFRPVGTETQIKHYFRVLQVELSPNKEVGNRRYLKATLGASTRRWQHKIIDIIELLAQSEDISERREALKYFIQLYNIPGRASDIIAWIAPCVAKLIEEFDLEPMALVQANRALRAHYNSEPPLFDDQKESNYNLGIEFIDRALDNKSEMNPVPIVIPHLLLEAIKTGDTLIILPLVNALLEQAVRGPNLGHFPVPTSILISTAQDLLKKLNRQDLASKSPEDFRLLLYIHSLLLKSRHAPGNSITSSDYQTILDNLAKQIIKEINSINLDPQELDNLIDFDGAALILEFYGGTAHSDRLTHQIIDLVADRLQHRFEQLLDKVASVRKEAKDAQDKPARLSNNQIEEFERLTAIYQQLSAAA